MRARDESTNHSEEGTGALTPARLEHSGRGGAGGHSGCGGTGGRFGRAGHRGRLARVYLAAELTAIFVALPVFLIFERRAFARLIIPTLLVIGTGCLLLLLRDPEFDRRRLWNASDLRAGLGRILRRLVPASVILGLVVARLAPGLLFALPRRAPGFWLLVMALYPLLSAYPQELIFRTFLFHRYRSLLRGERARIAVSAAAFALAHVFLANWIAPLLGLAGGLLFARTYARSGSTLQAVLEHGMWGDVLFTLGVGWYFYGGSIGAAGPPGAGG